MIVRQLLDDTSSTFTYVLADPQRGDAVIIDPVAGQFERDAAVLTELGVTLKYTLETHIHADHVTGSAEIRTRLGARAVVSSAAGVDCADIDIDNGGTLSFGDYTLVARHTPGHTAGCVSWVVSDGPRTFAFTGDTLLIGGCGRTDFQGGSAHALYTSVNEQLFNLPDDTVVFPGHDYRGQTSSTIGHEKRDNPRLRDGINESEFVAIMANLNLAPPKRIDVAVPANRKCGREVNSC
jgi:sulfur dioxygenase